MFDVIGFIVISLSRCCLPIDEGSGPQIFFLEPPLSGGDLQYNVAMSSNAVLAVARTRRLITRLQLSSAHVSIQLVLGPLLFYAILVSDCVLWCRFITVCLFLAPYLRRPTSRLSM